MVDIGRLCQLFQAMGIRPARMLEPKEAETDENQLPQTSLVQAIQEEFLQSLDVTAKDVRCLAARKRDAVLHFVAISLNTLVDRFTSQ